MQVEPREELGSEVDLHCNLGGVVGSGPAERVEPLHPVVVDDEAGTAEGDPADGAVAALAATIVARMDPKTTLRESDSAKVHVDLAALHFFDPETGASVRS